MRTGSVSLVAAVALVAGFLLGRGLPVRPAPWVPVLEETGFEYLDASVARLATGLDPVRGTEARSEEAAAMLRELRRLRYYYLPLTEVRQLVYDADRLLYLGDREGVRRNLLRAKEGVMSGIAAAGEGVRRALEELTLMIDRVLLAVEEGSPEVSVRFRELGHRVNLMLLRGEMTLSDEDFSPTR